MVAAFPVQPQPDLVAIHGHDDFFQHRAQDVLACHGSCSLMGPSLFQTGAEAEESGSFLCGEFVAQSSCSQIGQKRFTFLHSVQADVPGLLEVTGNKSVVWIDRFIAATRLIRPEAGFFQHEFGLAYAVVGFSTLIVNGVQGRFDAQWLQRTQDRGADHLVHALGSDLRVAASRKLRSGYALPSFPADTAPGLIATPSDHLTPKAAVAVFCSALWSGFSPPLTESTDLMASLATALKEEISTLARREVRRQTAPADKAVARCVRDIIALKREVQALEHDLASLGTPPPGPTVPPKKTSGRASPSLRAVRKVSATSTSAKPSPRNQFSGEALKAHRETGWAVCRQLWQASRRLRAVDLQLGAGQDPPAQEQRRRLDGNPANRQARSRQTTGEPQVRRAQVGIEAEAGREVVSERQPSSHPPAFSALCTAQASGRSRSVSSFTDEATTE